MANTAYQRKLLDLLVAEAKSFRQPEPPLVYDGPADFVVTHGRWHRPARQITFAPQTCFGNSIILAGTNEGWRYVEGYALPPARVPSERPILHAWVLDEAGAAIECTWPVVGAAYLGVEFSVGRADDATWNGDACVLADSQRGWPMFRSPWRGEDYSIAWPGNPRVELLDAVRRGEATLEQYQRVCSEVEAAL